VVGDDIGGVMFNKKKKHKIVLQDYLFIVTILFFLLGMVNIVFSWLGLVCAALPFVMAKRTGKKLWCQRYCPRAHLFTKAIGKLSLNLKQPKILRDGRGKRFLLTYFCINMMMATMSTVSVFFGGIAPMAHVRFLMFFKMPFVLPQLIAIPLSPAMLHLSYRLYSIMFTSTILGILLGIIFKPRTWCAVCPIQTLTTETMKKSQKNCESCV